MNQFIKNKKEFTGIRGYTPKPNQTNFDLKLGRTIWSLKKRTSSSMIPFTFWFLSSNLLDAWSG